MKTTFIWGALAVFIGLLSCEKDKPENVIIYDTIMPLEYFPAFPGSYWIYDNGDTLIVTGQYEKYVFNSAGYSAEPDYDTLMLPKLILNGIFNSPDTFAYVKEYSISKPRQGDYRDPAFKSILSLKEGAEFTIGGAVQGHKITGKTIKADTTIFIGSKEYNNVIMTIHFDYACVSGTGGTPEDCATIREYYARNVGLIKREKRNYPVETDFVKEIELIKYDIKKPASQQNLSGTKLIF